MKRALYAAAVLLAGAACEKASLPREADVGPAPTLPPPKKALVPTVEIAPALGWPPGAKPASATGTEVDAFATDLAHPRWLYVLPNGDVLVAETNAPPKPDDAKGVRGWLMKQTMKRAGSAGPSANRITLLRDADGDGDAETRTTFLDNLHSPFGMALIGTDFYVANSDAIVRFPYAAGDTRITAAATKLCDLPAGRINHHWTKNLIAGADGAKLYATVGSNSNVGENGIAVEAERAAIWEIDRLTGAHRVFASGLRNPNGLAWEPKTGALWTVVNERDELGSDLPPDYLTSVKDGGFYGWPYSYIGSNYDPRYVGAFPDLVKRAIVPDVLFPAHSAALGITFYTATQFPQRFRNGAFVALHGSWNRAMASGYRVAFFPMTNGKPGPLEDFMTGFIINDGEGGAPLERWGRPVGVTVAADGSLLVSDDGSNKIWKIKAAAR